MCKIEITKDLRETIWEKNSTKLLQKEEVGLKTAKELTTLIDKVVMIIKEEDKITETEILMFETPYFKTQFT